MNPVPIHLYIPLVPAVSALTVLFNETTYTGVMKVNINIGLN